MVMLETVERLIEDAVIEAGAGNVVGDSSSTDNNVATFDGTTGKIIQDSGKSLPTGSVVGTTDTQTLTNKSATDLKISQSGTGVGGQITASGSDTNIDLNIAPKGSGWVNVQGTLQASTYQNSRTTADGWGPTYVLNKSGSSAGVSTAIENHAEIGTIQGYGYSGTWDQAGFFGFWADADWSSTDNSTRFVVSHKEYGSTSNYRTPFQSDSGGITMKSDNTGDNFLRYRKATVNNLEFISQANDTDASTRVGSQNNTITLGTNGSNLRVYWSDDSGNKYYADIAGTTLS